MWTVFEAARAAVSPPRRLKKHSSLQMRNLEVRARAGKGPQADAI